MDMYSGVEAALFATSVYFDGESLVALGNSGPDTSLVETVDVGSANAHVSTT